MYFIISLFLVCRPLHPFFWKKWLNYEGLDKLTCLSHLCWNLKKTFSVCHEATTWQKTKQLLKWLKGDAQAIIDMMFHMLRRLCSWRLFQYNIRFFQWGKVFKNLPSYTPHPSFWFNADFSKELNLVISGSSTIRFQQRTLDKVILFDFHIQSESVISPFYPVVVTFKILSSSIWKIRIFPSVQLCFNPIRDNCHWRLLVQGAELAYGDASKAVIWWFRELDLDI